ncbi:MAG: exosortase/archaeosortase family protein [Promethearchaeota archaeon]
MLNLEAELILNLENDSYPIIYIPNHPFNGNYIISGACIGAHVFSIFIAIVLFVPSSRDPSTHKDFKWRKLKTLFTSILVIHVLNVFRIVFLIFFNFNGVPFEFIHQSLFFISAIIGALFFAYLLHKWLPELFISMYYIYPLITQKRLKSIENIQV